MNETFLNIINEYSEEIILEKERIYNKIKQNNLDFKEEINELVFRQGSKYRKVLVTNESSVEEIALKYLKKRLDSTFKILYPDRQKIMRECFAITETVSNVSEFVVYRYDFRDFFNTVKSNDVFSRYLKYSDLYRFEKDLIESVFQNIQYCSPGLPISNALVELISRDLDVKLKSLLHDHGLIFYSRYIDDSLMIFNRFIEEEKILENLKIAIKQVFTSSNIKLNKQKTKYLHHNSLSGDTFDYLGYLFEYTKEQNKKNEEVKYFKYGITREKLDQNRKNLIKIIKEYKNFGNMELFRQRILFWSSRVVFYNTSRNHYSTSVIWDVIGIISTYGGLRYFLHHSNKIERDTLIFLKNEIHRQTISILGFCPYFLKTKTNGYILEDRLLKNKSIIFHPKIGWSKHYLINMIKKINPNFDPRKKSYRKLVTEYCNMLKI